MLTGNHAKRYGIGPCLLCFGMMLAIIPLVAKRSADRTNRSWDSSGPSSPLSYVGLTLVILTMGIGLILMPSHFH